METLGESGPLGAAAAQYLRDHRIRISVRKQSAGARWTADRRVEIHPRYAAGVADTPYALSLLVHEVQHLQQGPLRALSVYGELDAWRVQFNFLQSLDAPIPGTDRQQLAIRQLLDMPMGWRRENLFDARALMREYAGKSYRVDLLPLYPLHLEVLYWLTRRVPEG